MKTTRAFFFFNDTATTEIYTLSLHDALPICRDSSEIHRADVGLEWAWRPPFWGFATPNLSRVPGLLAARKRRRSFNLQPSALATNSPAYSKTIVGGKPYAARGRQRLVASGRVVRVSGVPYAYEDLKLGVVAPGSGGTALRAQAGSWR